MMVNLMPMKVEAISVMKALRIIKFKSTRRFSLMSNRSKWPHSPLITPNMRVDLLTKKVNLTHIISCSTHRLSQTEIMKKLMIPESEIFTSYR